MKLNTKDKGKSGIYCIRNTVNNKLYIGKALCIYRRIKDHITRLNKKNKDENPYLIKSWQKNGKDSFIYYVIEYCDINLLSERELYWIKTYDSINKDKGYNIRLDSCTGMIVSKETREKQRQSQLKRFQNPEERRKVSHTYWKDNPDKLKEMSQKVAQLNVKYKIEQYTKSNQLIKIWDSIIELIKSHPEYKKHNIYAVCSGQKPTMYGFIWKKVMI